MRTLTDSPIKAGETAIVIGSGASGLAAAKLLRLLGARVRLLDSNPKGFSEAVLALGAELGLELVSGEHQLKDFKDAALVVPSPGVPLQKLEPLLIQAGNPPVISELELAASFAHEDILAITGTSGKTTTVSLAAAMLEEAGKKVFLGGNIGTPLSEYIVKREQGKVRADILVLEVSSFQLQACRGFHPKVAVLLNLSENHLDQHRDMAEYTEAKLNIFRNQILDDVAIFGDELFGLARTLNLRSRTEYFAASERFINTRLLGRHNRANIEAAYLAVSEFGVSYAQAVQAVEHFQPLEHRLELVGEWDGVSYVNDSKCTTVEALRKALESFDAPVLLLAGGIFKGGDLQSLRFLLTSKVKHIGLFGASRELFEGAWKDAAPISWDETLEPAMRRLRGMAASGDIILLAPATSSFDLYANYQERGKDFKRLAEIIK